MSYTILVDFDDVLIDFCPHWIQEINKLYGTSVKITDIKSWSIKEAFPTLTFEQLIEPIIHDDFWKEVPVKKDAIEIIAKLIVEGYDIYICTATDYRNYRSKIENILIKYFPSIPLKNVINCYNKQLLKADALIDDKYDNLINGSYVGILFSTHHNKNCKLEDKIYRVDNWYDCYSLIHTLFPGEKE